MTLAQKLRLKWDLLVVDDLGRATMAVEIKSRRGADAPYAISLWRRALGPGEPDAATLLVTTDRMFFWSPGAGLGDAPVEAPTLPIYGDWINPAVKRVDDLSLALVVENWLNGVAEGDPIRIAEPMASRIEARVRGHRVVREA